MTKWKGIVIAIEIDMSADLSLVKLFSLKLLYSYNSEFNGNEITRFLDESTDINNLSSKSAIKDTSMNKIQNKDINYTVLDNFPIKKLESEFTDLYNYYMGSINRHSVPDIKLMEVLLMDNLKKIIFRKSFHNDIKRKPFINNKDLINTIHSIGSRIPYFYNKSIHTNENESCAVVNSYLLYITAHPYIDNKNRSIHCSIFKIRRVFHKTLRCSDIPMIINSKTCVTIHRVEEALSTFPFPFVDHETLGFQEFFSLCSTTNFKFLNEFMEKVKNGVSHNRSKTPSKVSKVAFRKEKMVHDTELIDKQCSSPQSAMSDKVNSIPLNESSDKPLLNDSFVQSNENKFSTTYIPDFKNVSQGKSRPNHTLFVIPSITNDEWKIIKKNHKIGEKLNQVIPIDYFSNKEFLSRNEAQTQKISEESIMKKADNWGEKKSDGEGQVDMPSLVHDISLSSLHSTNKLQISSNLLPLRVSTEFDSPITKVDKAGFP